jgi:hypothetical protein
MPSRYPEQTMTVRVLYRQNEDTWVASSPGVPRWTAVACWTAVADTATAAGEHRLAEEVVRFALEREDLADEHYFPTGVAIAAQQTSPW